MTGPGGGPPPGGDGRSGPPPGGDGRSGPPPGGDGRGGPPPGGDGGGPPPGGGEASRRSDDHDRSADSRDAITHYRVVLETLLSPTRVVPPLTIFLNESRSGGWVGGATVNPRLASSETAFQTLLADGLVPGAGMLVKLIIAGDTGYTGTAVRFWPSVITSVSSTRSGLDEEAFCGIMFRDPLSYFRNRTVWTAFARCSPGEILGGALSAAAGGDGRPTRAPVLPGMPAITIEEQLREEIGEIPYTIATGEPLGYWLNRVFGRLGIRIEMRGDESGALKIGLRDIEPAESSLNDDGGVNMTIKWGRFPSATNFTIGAPQVNAPITGRGGLLDTPSSGAVQRFGRTGAVETVISAAGTGLEEAEKRAGFRLGRHGLAEVRIALTSCQPGLFPGRVVKIGGGRLDADEEAGGAHGFTSMFGAKEWQVADVSHVFSATRYWNRAELEKTGAAWRPALPDEVGAHIVSGVVDDGESETGASVERDRLGRIPIRFPFPSPVEPVGTTSPPAGDGRAWPHSIPLGCIELFAGNLHGAVSAHRQGDWCRVAVMNPFSAEIIGFGYRDDRYLNAKVRDATMGMVVRQGQEDWRGMLFRPDEDLERELVEPEPEGEDSGSQDEDGESHAA